MSQQTFEWTTEDRARLVPGCAVIVHIESGPVLATVFKVYQEQVFYEQTTSYDVNDKRRHATYRPAPIAVCDPSTIMTAQELAAARGGQA